MHTNPYDYFSSHDGLRLRYGHWLSEHGPSRGTVAVLGGRSEFAEKYRETIRDLLRRGFDVFYMDWRGQGLSERLLSDTTKGHVETYDHYVLDLERFMKVQVAKKGRPPYMVMAHSMGANIALQLLSRDPCEIERAILLAPLVDIQTYPIPAAFARWCSALSVKAGLGHQGLPVLRYHDSYHRPFRSNRLTHDPLRFDHVRDFLKKNSHLTVSTITFGWLAATFAAIDHIRQPDFLKSITAPVLLVLAGQDRVVRNSAARQIAPMMPASKTVTINGAYHEILQEQDLLRDQFWQAFEAFAMR